MVVILTPTACTFTQPRNIDDHIKWLMDHGKYEVYKKYLSCLWLK